MGRQRNKGPIEDRQTTVRAKKAEQGCRLPETVELRPRPGRAASTPASSSLPASQEAVWLLVALRQDEGTADGFPL